MIESLFVVSGYLVSAISLPASIVFIAFLPLYAFAGFVASKPLVTRSSLIAVGITALCLSFMMSSVFVATAMALGAWG
ncbi:hypothetical protein CS022_06850 [Veronia nyctiphanis]|uniref:Uncharacterized protein n=1 Tax=Veronia nyctiphanis TaxID=1278244 RepID=A0A4Q0YTE0_9GAMM|nr:hypothetical protein [Veronia nyctiphanis]RXJ73985.1 hypothetical protein CS022_06850 [Veronia nyctiphanis]